MDCAEWGRGRALGACRIVAAATRPFRGPWYPNSTNRCDYHTSLPSCAHRQLPRAPSSKGFRWKYSVGQWFDPTEHSHQSPLRTVKAINMKISTVGVEYPIKYHLIACIIPNLTSALSVSSTFWPLMSRWMTLLACRWANPRRISRQMYAIHSSLRLCPLVAKK